MALALHGYDAGAGQDLDIVRVLNPIDEIFGHVFCERLVAHQHRNLASILREVDGSLPGGVRPANYVHVLIAARHSLGDRGTIIDASTGQGIYAGDIQFAVRDAAGEQEGVAAQFQAVRQVNTAVLAIYLDPHRLLRGDDLGAKTLRLRHGTTRQLSPAHSCRKAQVVLDTRTRSRLTARSLLLHKQGAQSLGGTIDSRGKPCWTGADDDQVVKRLFRVCFEVDLLGNLVHVGVHQVRTIGENHDWQFLMA